MEVQKVEGENGSIQYLQQMRTHRERTTQKWKTRRKGLLLVVVVVVVDEDGKKKKKKREMLSVARELQSTVVP